MRTPLLALLASALALSAAAQAPAPAAPGQPAAPAAPAAGGAAPLNLEQEMEALFNDAQATFTQGKFDVALQKIGAIHTKTSNKDYEMVMFLEGACHFNLKAYDKAVTFFEDFIKKFPQSGSINDAKMALGEAYLLAGNAEKGIAALKEAAAVEELRDKAGMMIANHYKTAGNADEALAILEVVLKDLVGSPTLEQQQAILMASDIYMGKGETDKAQAMMEKLRSGTQADESVVELNILQQKVGDGMLEAKRYGEALRAYQGMRRKSELVRLQKQRVARIEQWVATLAQPNGRVNFMGRALGKEEADAMLARNKTILTEIEAVADYDANIYYRLGQCFFEMGRMYEANLAFKKLYEEFKGHPGRDGALFGMIAANERLGLARRAYQLCEAYMKEFPDGKFIGEVSGMFGRLAYESGNMAAAETALRGVASGLKDADQKEAILFLLGVVQFEAQKFDESRLTFTELIGEKKDSTYKDAGMYYIALTYFFQNNSKEFRKAAKAYLAANPKGEYIVDAQYRLAFIEVQDPKGDKADAKNILEKLTVEHPNDPNVGQVWSLLGDIYSQATDPDGKVDYGKKTMEAYRNAVDKAKTPDVKNYAIDAAHNLMQEAGLWSDIITMWTDYYNANQGKPEALKAIHYIATARERLAKEQERDGKVDEAKKTRDDARALVAKEMLPHLGNPGNEQVELLIQQLVTMMLPKKRPRAAPVAAPAPPAPDAAAPSADPNAAPAPAPVVAEVKIPTFEEVEEEFKKLLTPPDGGQVNGTAAARTLYGRALIARGFRDVPKFENLIGIIPDAAKVEDLSPLLLATMGDIMFKKGDHEKAAEYFTQIRTKYPNSEFGDRAPNGLAEIAYQKKEYQQSLDLFNEAIEKYAFSEESILTASLGKAKCLLATNKWDEAEKLYMTILNTREWRAAHATALLGLGKVSEAKKDQKKAITFYRKILLTWRKDKAILFEAYLRCAKNYIQIADNKSAREVLDEMLRQKELVDHPELQAEAQQLISTVSSS